MPHPAALPPFAPARGRACSILVQAASLALALTCPSGANAALSAEELAKLAQNPVGNLISVPFQNNTNLNFGPEKGTQNILNIQPVIRAIALKVDN